MFDAGAVERELEQMEEGERAAHLSAEDRKALGPFHGRNKMSIGTCSRPFTQ